MNDNDTIKYTATVVGRGYEDEDLPRLDSISFSYPQKQIENSRTITKTVYKTKRWNIAPSVGFGYGLVNKNTDVFVGVSVSYNLFK